jgi:hypothetical protein
MGRGGLGWAATLSVLAVFAGSAGAQQRSADPAGYFAEPAGYVGASFVGADAVGQLSAYIDNGFGGQIWGAMPLEPTNRFRLRADFGFLIYGNEHRNVCLAAPVGCRIELDMNTTNAILYGGLGPELVLMTGPIEPYVNASFGFTYFGTTTSLSGTNNADDFASTTNYSDGMFAWRAGGGVRMRVSAGRTPVWLDFGVERHENGVAEFLTKGDIIDHPDGSITLLPNRSEANLVAFRFGVTVGIPHRRGDDAR